MSLQKEGFNSIDDLVNRLQELEIELASFPEGTPGFIDATDEINRLEEIRGKMQTIDTLWNTLTTLGLPKVISNMIGDIERLIGDEGLSLTNSFFDLMISQKEKMSALLETSTKRISGEKRIVRLETIVRMILELIKNLRSKIQLMIADEGLQSIEDLKNEITKLRIMSSANGEIDRLEFIKKIDGCVCAFSSVVESHVSVLQTHGLMLPEIINPVPPGPKPPNPKPPDVIIPIPPVLVPSPYDHVYVFHDAENCWIPSRFEVRNPDGSLKMITTKQGAKQVQFLEYGKAPTGYKVNANRVAIYKEVLRAGFACKIGESAANLFDIMTTFANVSYHFVLHHDTANPFHPSPGTLTSLTAIAGGHEVVFI